MSLWKTTASERITHVLESWIFPDRVETTGLAAALDDLEKTGALNDSGAITALCAFANTGHVALHLRQRSPALRIQTMAELIVDSSSLPEVARPHARAAFDHALLMQPDLRASLPAVAHALGDKILSDGGHGLPEATSWKSPWDAAPARPPVASVPVPAMASWPEAFHPDNPSAVVAIAPDAARDAEAVASWKSRTHDGKHFIYPFHQMGDPAGLAIWNTVKARQLMVGGDEFTALVERFGLPGLAASLRFVEENPGTIAALSRLESPRAATLMAAALASRPAMKTLARAWFERFAEAGAVGLVPAALDSDSTASGCALEAIRHLGRVAPRALASAMARYEAPVREAIDQLLARGVELPSRKPVLPAFADPRGLPRPITAEGASLRGEVFADLVRLLKLTPLDGAPWIAQMRAAFTPVSMGRLVRALFDAWLAAAAPAKEKWALQALAHFPDDGLARELAEQAAALAPQGLSARAQEMVEVLAAMQTRASLKWVHHLSRKVRSKAFRTRAELAFTTAAEKMGLTEDELGERLISDFGLSPDGALPVEPRTVLVLDGVKARFVDASGKTLKALPVVADEDLQSQLTDLKKKGTALLREVADRLERRMVHGRAMSLEHFTEVYALHGLARRIAERLVWGVWGTTLETTFALGAAGAVDEAGNAVVLPEGKTIGVVHPLDLSADQRLGWTTRLGEGQPFEQLARHTARFASVEELRMGMAAHVGKAAEPGALLGLARLGWERGELVGGDCYVSYARSLPTGRVEVSFSPGIHLSNPTMDRQQIVGVVVNLREPTAAQLMSEIDRDLRSTLSA